MAAARKPGGRSSSCWSATTDQAALFCKWKECSDEKGFSSANDLLQHLEEAHCRLNGTNPVQSLVCLWEGCRFYNLPNSSQDWLSRHAKIHTKTRPHKCLMNGCSSSFWTVPALNDHLQLHFAQSPSSSSLAGAGKGENGKQPRKPKLKSKRAPPVSRGPPPPTWTRPLDLPFGPLSYPNPLDPPTLRVVHSYVQALTLNMVEAGADSLCVRLTGKVPTVPTYAQYEGVAMDTYTMGGVAMDTYPGERVAMDAYALGGVAMDMYTL